MTTEVAVGRDPASLRLMSAALAVLAFTSAFGALITGGLIAAGHDVSLDATLTGPVTVETPETVWELTDDVLRTRHPAWEREVEDRQPDDPAPLFEPRAFGLTEVAGTVHLRSDTHAGAAATYRVGLVLLLSALGVAFAGLRRVVEAARAGDPFNPANPRRFRVVGAACLAMPLISKVVESELAGTTVEPGVAISHTLIPWLMPVALAVGAFALAEIFRHGTELRDFERTAI